MAARLSSTEEELTTTVSRSRSITTETSITTTSRVTSSSTVTSDTSTLVRVTRPTTTSSTLTEIEETTLLPTTRSTTSARVSSLTTDTPSPVVEAATPVRSLGTPSNAQGLASATSTAFSDVAAPEKTNVIGPVVGAVGGLVVLLLLAWLGRMCYKRKHSKKDLARLDKMYKGEDKFEGGIYEDKGEKPIQHSYGSLGSPNPISDFTPPSPAFVGAPYATMSGSSTSLSRPSSIRSFDSSAPFFPSTDRDITAQLPNTKAHTMSRPSSPILPSEHFISPSSPLSNPFTTPTLSQDGFRSSTPPLPSSPVPLLESNPPTIQIEDNSGSYVITNDDDSIHETKKHDKKESVTDFGFMGALMEEEKEKEMK